MPDPRHNTKDEQVEKLVRLASHHANELYAVAKELAKLGHEMEIMYGHPGCPVNGCKVHAGMIVKK